MQDIVTETLQNVLLNVTGRSADTSPNYFNTRLVARLAMEADGDVLEIGTFFGASAITIARLISGTVYCIDPLDGRKQMEAKQRTGNLRDWGSGATWNEKTFRDNCKRNGVDNVVLITKTSLPVPVEIAGMSFGLIYIDGDHWHDQPFMDWLNYSLMSDRFVAFDDVDVAHPHVVKAVAFAKKTFGWKVYMRDASICVMEKI
jgi:predicted O-methyltransferase YrrM